MRVFVTGSDRGAGTAPGAGLVAAGHQVTATTRSAAKTGQLREAGAEPVVVDGLDREAVIAAVRAAAPEVIVHQMTALADMRSLRRFDRVFAATNELRTKGTDNLLAAAAEAGTRRLVAQSYTGWPNERSGSPVKTENDPLDPAAHPVGAAVAGGDQAPRASRSRWRAGGHCAALRQLLRSRSVASPCSTSCASGSYR